MHRPRPTRRRVAALTATTLTAALVPFVGTAITADAAPTELFFSEYVEGSSNNKALEIFNGTGSTIDLGAAGYNVQMFFNGSVSAGLTINLSGTVSSGDAYVLAHSSSGTAILAQADQTNGSGWYNGDDAIVLRKGATVLDVIGQIGVDPGTEWGTGLASTADNTLRRKGAIQAGETNGADAFDPSVEWDGFATDTFDGLGSHTVDAGPAADAAPAVASTTPADGASGIATAANLSVTFSEPVALAAGAFTLACTDGGARTLTVTGGPTTFTLDPTADFAAGDACTLTAAGGLVSDADVNDPPDTMASDVVVRFSTESVNRCEAPITPIPAIQGSGATVARTGSVTTRGVVVGDYEGASPNLRGFYIQDPAGDGDEATSDGIFVFEGSNADAVKLGDLVTVTGNAGENQGQSQISAGTITVCASDQPVPSTDVKFPVASQAALESYEGMMVRLPQTMYVTEHYLLGRFGQVTLSAGGRLQQPTNVVEPGAEAAALQASNDLHRILLDDGSQAQNPDPVVWGRDGAPLSATNTLRGGDTATGIVGVMTYTWGGNSASPNAYRVRPMRSLGGHAEFEAANPRPTGGPDVGGSLQVAGMNVLNYFNTFSGCTQGVGGGTTDCRGADNTTEFQRQAAKTVTAITKMGAEVVGLVEIENDGYGGSSAIADLVSRLNAEQGDGTWAYVDVDARTGEVNALGTDAIKVGAIYQPAKVTPVGQTAVLNTESFVTGGDNGERNRPALAQAFRERATGGVFTAVVNHLKSKGSACGLQEPEPDTGQGNCNLVRVNAAKELVEWLDSDPARTGDDDVLVLGDLNSYAKEDPIDVLVDAGYTNLIADQVGEDAYSYVFDGQWGYLDHALGSASIDGQVAGVADWHVNADEPTVLDYNTNFKTPGQVGSLYAPDEFRNSDHDPVVVGLKLTNAAPELAEVDGPDAAVRKGTSTSVTAAYTDADRLDTHTATIAWGDGNTTAGTITDGTVTGSHSYAAAGLYTVTVTVRDEWGNADSATFEHVVVYDPAAGFVNGGGSISAPSSGKYPAGKGEFQLAAKYESGASTPIGSVEYTLGSALTVRAASLDWLVVTSRTAMLSGAATVNGAPGYEVVVTVEDGNKKPDTLRIVVHDGAGVVVYDSAVRTVMGQVTLHP